MAYIKAGGDVIAGGDITVVDGNQNTYKPFEQCTPDELRVALARHSKLAKQERRRINYIAFKFLALAIFVGLVLAVWRQLAGDFNNAVFLIGLVGVGMPVLLAIQVSQKRSPFEQRQFNTIEYLHMLLRERT